MNQFGTSFLTQDSKDVHEEHDDVEVEHQGSNDVVVHVDFYAWSLFAAGDQDGVDDQVDAV